jgi:hypothetical protein
LQHIFHQIVPGFQNPYKEVDLSEYLKSLIIQIIKKASHFQLPQKIQRVDEKSTSVQSLTQKSYDLHQITFVNSPSGIKEVSLNSILLSRSGTECP